MKTRLFILALLTFGVWACSSDDDSNNNMIFTSSRLTADVNGERFESVTVFDSIQGGQINTILNIDGINENNDMVSVGVSFSGPDTIEIGMLSGSGAFYDDSESRLYLLSSTNNSNGSGTVTITSDNGEEIKGTFSFEAYSFTHPDESVIVTNGEFTAEYYFPDN